MNLDIQTLITPLLFTLLAFTSVRCNGVKVQLATTPNLDVIDFGSHLYMEVTEPEDVSYLFKLRPAKNFGGDFNKQHFGIALVPADPYHGCSQLNNRQLLKESVALIQRGGCSFVTKTYNAEQAGAIAAIITDSDEDNDQGGVEMIQDGTERDVTIPSLYLLGKDGFMIKKTIEKYHLPSAIINIPINITAIPMHQRHNRPPWVLW